MDEGDDMPLLAEITDGDQEPPKLVPKMSDINQEDVKQMLDFFTQADEQLFDMVNKIPPEEWARFGEKIHVKFPTTPITPDLDRLCLPWIYNNTQMEDSMSPNDAQIIKRDK